jgi:hypothetical protein
MVREPELSGDVMDDELNESIEQLLERVDQVPDEPAIEIKFLRFNIYNNSEENVVEYVSPPNYEDAGADWIGVYRVRLRRKNYSKFNNWLILSLLKLSGRLHRS